MIKKDDKPGFKHDFSTQAERTPESESERRGIIDALDSDVADMKTSKAKSRKYSITEFTKKF